MNFDPAQMPYILVAGAIIVATVTSCVCVLVLAGRHKRQMLALRSETQMMLDSNLAQIRDLELSNTELKAKQEAAILAASDQAKKLSQVSDQLERVVSQKHLAEQQHKVIEAQLAEREAGFERQLKQIDEQKQVLAKEFELLANKVLEEKGKRFEEQSKSQLDSVLRPFKDQIDGFQKRVNEVHTESVQGNSKLEAQIKNILEVGLKMSGEAHSLTQALKGDKKAQGNWSEVQAELLLEMSGLSQGREYVREASFKTDDGKDQRPDFIVNLPNDKHIIIDSKISLNSYVEAIAAETEEDYQKHLLAHVESIRNHVRSLSDKNYAKLKGINSPEYIFMFMGSEPAYLTAANKDPALFQDAYRKGIAIVTPNTLLSSLRIVSHLWSIDKQNANTRQLAEQASKVYDKLRVFSEKMQKLGSQISTVQRTYDESWNTLKDGRGSLARQVDKFVEMGVSVKEKLPSALVDSSEQDED